MEVQPNAYTIDNFCASYGIRRNLAYDEMKAGRLVCRKVGRRTLIGRDDAAAWFNSLPLGTNDKEGTSPAQAGK
jgi:hypothetical protein